MNIFDVLEAEGARILSALIELRESPASPPAERRRRITEAADGIRRRSRIVEELLDPLVWRRDDTRAAAAESREERQSIDAHLDELEETPTADPQFLARTEALYLEVERHLRREERERFPLARAVVSEDEAERLGERAVDLEREWARTT